MESRDQCTQVDVWAQERGTELADLDDTVSAFHPRSIAPFLDSGSKFDWSSPQILSVLVGVGVGVAVMVHPGISLASPQSSKSLVPSNLKN